MVASVRINYQDRSVRRLLRGIPGAVDKATARGLNKGVAQGKTQAKNQIKARRNLPVRDVINRDIYTRKASRHRHSARVVVDGRVRSLRRYGARVVGQRGRGKKKGKARSPVQVSVIPGRRKTVQGGFIVSRRQDHVFRREGTARYPLKLLWGPSTTSAFRAAAVVRHMETWAARKVPGLIEHELRRELKRVRR